MFKGMVLVCSMWMAIEDCTEKNAVAIEQAGHFQNLMSCLMQSQFFAASIHYNQGQTDLALKIVCRPIVEAKE